MSRCVIVSAAPIANYKKIAQFLRPSDYFIFCDGGLVHSGPLGVAPSLIIGDFDSFDKRNLSHVCNGDNVETIFLPCEKDDTDTFFAIKEGLKRGFQEFLLLGAVGNRFDHSLCNISALIYLHNRKARAFLIDDFSEMEVIGDGVTALIPDTYSYFSLMNIDGDVSCVTIRNAKYLLEKASIKAEFSLGVSNQVLPGNVAEVSVGKGIMLLVKVW